jgi:hypothetical protein
MAIGRNDPCPCGSGKKYKRCHGAGGPPASPDVARANELKSLDSDLTLRLLKYARTRVGDSWLDDAIQAYLGTSDGKVDEREFTLAIPWAVHHWTGRDGRALAAEWAADRRSRVTERERLLLDAYGGAWLSMWEVSRVDRGVGVALVDRLTHEERFAFDVSASSTLDIHDTMLAFILDCGGVSFFGGVHPQPLTPYYAESAVRAAQKMCRVRTRAVDPARLRSAEIQVELIDIWNDLADAMVSAPPPTITNTDGDRVEPTTDDFEMTGDRATLLERLASIDGAEGPQDEDGETVFVFTKPGNAMHRNWDNTIIGRAVVAERHVRVETNSHRRADALRAILERALPGLLRFRLRQQTNPTDLMRRAMVNGPSAPGAGALREQPPPEALAALRDFRQQHMRSWVDESIPALGGRTPREAARTPQGRRALELLLKDIERSESRLSPDEQIDLSWLRPELGI